MSLRRSSRVQNAQASKELLEKKLQEENYSKALSSGKRIAAELADHGNTRVKGTSKAAKKPRTIETKVTKPAKEETKSKRSEKKIRCSQAFCTRSYTIGCTYSS
ncbi:hypothetical protein DSO57_1027308 [Entomophthora muscae]|uniref:Uncharacterized protein n=1 Tax=Entomophthora muscae TaxID=34485 RepID=A0ACC2S3P4_9FUNG|nr:hypothetical protein DSO57_1027308 [Entomophthora muscae]